MEANKPAWIELSSTDPAGSREFYKTVFDWKIEVSPDPQYGGYALAYTGSDGVGGIGGKQPGDTGPSSWSMFVGTDSADETAKKVAAAGGTVVAPPFDVPAQGRMLVFQDPSGAFLSGWQATAHQGFKSGGEGQFGWAELSARGLQKTLPFYKSVFGWDARTSAATAPDQPPYTEFKVGDQSIAGAIEMPAMVPTEVPSYWMPYFSVKDVDGTFKKARDAGAKELVAPEDFPGGRFAIVEDPQGAAFGLLRS
ncbi:VOC family protein [soil metagenome]